MAGGGAIFAASATVSDSYFADNQVVATGGSPIGGAIAIDFTDPGGSLTD